MAETAGTAMRPRVRFSLSSQPSPIGTPAFTQVLPRVGESAGMARLMVSHASEEWGLATEVTEAAQLVVTELVANAVDHARGSHIHVSVARLSDVGFYFGITDRSRKEPILRTPGDDEVEGRGLWLVNHLSKGRWGTDERPWGKRVWAEVRP